jgi:ribosomal-protein-alanine N-acetyltransferase
MNDDGGIVLQPLGPLDVAVAAAVHASCFDDGWSEAALAEILAMPGCAGALALADDQPIGFVVVLGVAADAEIITLGVVPEFRRRGIGGRLLAWASDRSRGAGCRRLLLEVAEDNPAARALYGKLGFSQVGRRPSYYRRSAGTAAAMILARDLE